jgi:hypothetical protein
LIDHCKALFYKTPGMITRHLLQLLIVLTGILFSENLRAQTANHFSGWGAWFNSTRLNSKFALHFDGQVRSNNEWKEVQQVLIRPGINYFVNKKQIATLGYAFIDHHRFIDGVSGWGPEHRIWEQYIINQSFSISNHFTTLQHRIRLEQRFISVSEAKDNALHTSKYNFAQRLRYFARSIFPLQKSSTFKQGTFVSLQDEIMFNIGDASATNGKFFDQNRAYTSIGYRFSPKLDLELGYMYQYISGKNNTATNNNILQLAVYTRF